MADRQNSGVTTLWDMDTKLSSNDSEQIVNHVMRHEQKVQHKLFENKEQMQYSINPITMLACITPISSIQVLENINKVKHKHHYP
mmetsp:Transcript_24266/g.31512  ORF Transcript_24266/g.31512 Transcript_24266/m.31512 type:complete len:85 (+) Transcript_24266:63-317(+)